MSKSKPCDRCGKHFAGACEEYRLCWPCCSELNRAAEERTEASRVANLPSVIQEAVVDIRKACTEEHLKVTADRDRLLAILEDIHPRVLKLASRDEPFIVIGMREPYFMRAYRLIRSQEISNGSWSFDDLKAYERAMHDHERYIQKKEEVTDDA